MDRKIVTLAAIGAVAVAAALVTRLAAHRAPPTAEAGAVPADRIAAWDGRKWSALGRGLNSKANALAWHSGALYAGGAFTNAGTLQGLGAMNIGAANTLTNNGIVSPGTAGTPTGTLTIAGKYAQGAGGQLNVDLEGTVAGQYDKLAVTGAPGPVASAAPGEASADILNALLALGYNDREATAAMRQLPAGIGVSDGIRQALKQLAKP